MLCREGIVAKSKELQRLGWVGDTLVLGDSLVKPVIS